MAELGSEPLIPASVRCVLGHIVLVSGPREVGGGHSGVRGREREGGAQGSNLPGSWVFFLAGRSGQAWAGGVGLGSVSSCSVVGSFVF